MKNQSKTHESEETALRRYELITEVKILVDQAFPLALALDQVSNRTLEHREGSVARRTLEDWWYAYQKGGFGALKPKERSDRGRSRKLTPAQEQWILDAVRTLPEVPIRTQYEFWKKTDSTLPSLSAVHRLLWRHDLNLRQRRQQVRQRVGSATKAWESAGVNELWMVDFSPGPWILPEGGGKGFGTHLCVILDDYSRLATCARYTEAADTQSFHWVLKEAVKRRGIPQALYADNGGPFVNDHTRVVCANLGVRLQHARPYHAWSKGKVERFIYSVQEGFETGLKLPGQAPRSLEDLNQKLSAWLEEYHTRPHSTTKEKPQDRFARQANRVRSVESNEKLERLFYMETKRLVRKDATVRLGNRWYEVDLCLRGLTVKLTYDVWKMKHVEVEYGGKRYSEARELNRTVNGQINPAHQ